MENKTHILANEEIFPNQKWNNVLCLLHVLSEGHLSYYLVAHQEKVVSGFHSKAFELNYPILIRYKINAVVSPYHTYSTKKFIKEAFI